MSRPCAGTRQCAIDPSPSLAYREVHGDRRRDCQNVRKHHEDGTVGGLGAGNGREEPRAQHAASRHEPLR